MNKKTEQKIENEKETLQDLKDEILFLEECLKSNRLDFIMKTEKEIKEEIKEIENRIKNGDYYAF